MKLNAFVVALCLVATCSGEEDVKKAETQDKKAVADMTKEFATMKAELKRLREETGKATSEQKKEIEEQKKRDEERKKENKELRQQLARQKIDSDIQIREAIAKQRVQNDQKKLEMDEENFKLVELVKQRDVKQQSKRQNDVAYETRKLCRSEILKYHQAHNDSESLKSIIISEIKNYLSTAEMTLLKARNGKAGCDRCGSNGPKGFFDESQTGGWVSGFDNKASAYTAPFPHLVWYEFAAFHIPAKFSFTRHMYKEYSQSRTPKTWKFVGSADENCDHSSNWVELCGDLSGGNFVPNAVRSCEVPKYARTAFRCLGIRILSNNNAKNPTVTESWLGSIRFWEV